MALSWFLFLSLAYTSTLLSGFQYSAARDDRKPYIVYMGDLAPQSEPATSATLHMSMLQKVVGRDVAPGSLLHSYKRSLNGFVAKLTDKEAQEMTKFLSTMHMHMGTIHTYYDGFTK